MKILVGVMLILLFLSKAVNILCFSVPRGIQRVTKNSPFSMNIFTDFVKIEQDKITLRTKELNIEEKKLNQAKVMSIMKMNQAKVKLNQDKEMSIMKMSQENKMATIRMVVYIFAILAFLVFSAQLKDGLLGQATSFNSYFKSFCNLVKELKVSINHGLKIIAGTVSIKPMCNALSKLYNILRDILSLLKWRFT